MLHIYSCINSNSGGWLQLGCTEGQAEEAEQVEKFVRSLSITIPAKYEDEIYKLYLTDI